MAAIHCLLVAASTAFVFIDYVPADVSNYNLRSRAAAAGWNHAQPLLASTFVQAGVVVSASTTSVYAMDSGTTVYPPGSRWFLRNAGYIVGMGGAGSTGVGGAGGPAFRTIASLPVDFDNGGGFVAGGGGGGGGGGSGTMNLSSNDGDTTYHHSAVGSGGIGGGGATGRIPSSPNGGFAAAGPGLAGGTQYVGPNYAAGGAGGAGGAWGQSGGTGANAGYAYSGGDYFFNNWTVGAYGYGGGAGGAATSGHAHINWVNVGTRLGILL